MKSVSVTLVLTLAIYAAVSSAFAVNRALSLDGDGDYMVINSSPVLNTQIFTIEMWVNSDSVDNKFLFSRTTTSSNNGVLFGFDKGKLVFFFNNSEYYGKSPIPTGEWQHVALVYDGNVAFLFLNGINDGRFNIQTTFNYNSNIFLGIDQDCPNGCFDVAQFVDGKIDEVRIWNVARTQEEIQSTMYTELRGDEPGLAAYYRFNTLEDLNVGEAGFKVDDVRDWSGNGNHGDLEGGALLVDSTAPINMTVITGIIVGAENNKGLSGVSLELLDDAGAQIAQICSKANGFYSFAGVPEGRYRLRASKLWYNDTVSPPFTLAPQEVKHIHLTLQPEQGQYVLSLDGKGDYVEAANTESLDLTDNFTFEAWVFPVAISDENMIFNKEETYEWAIKNGTLQWALMTAGSWDWHDTGVSVPINQWTHLALTYTSPDVSVYKNGVLVSTISDQRGGKLDTNDNALRIGARGAPGNAWSFFAGYLDEVRIWNTARAQEEIQRDMRRHLIGDEPGLVGYWTFDAKNAMDESGHGNNGILIGDAKIVKLNWAIQPMGFTKRTFTLTLTKGLNFISIPVKPIVPYTARSLVEKLNATILVRWNTEAQTFEAFIPEVFEGDGFTIEGGQGYIVNVMEDKEVTFEGTVWSNAPPISAGNLPNTSWAFLIGGTLLSEDGKFASGRYTLIIRNLRTGRVSLAAVGYPGEGRFIGAFVDMSHGDVVEAGDIIEVKAVGENGEVVAGPIRHRVRVGEVERAYGVVELRIGDVIPSRTCLLPNYPNPFNPETWIPFRLAEGGEVRIRIYDLQGRLVKELNLGRLGPGSYINKAKAAYWDGRSDQGEQVASGVYVCQMVAGEKTFVRKMVILR